MKRFTLAANYGVSTAGMKVYVNPDNVVACEIYGEGTRIRLVDGSCMDVEGEITHVAYQLEKKEE